MTDLPYTYFVSYSHGMGFGSMEVFSSQPVTGYADVKHFAHTIGSTIGVSVNRIVVLNYQLLSGPGTCGHCGGHAAGGTR